MIDRFRGDYDFLSNFYPATVWPCRNIEYPTVEHAFQAAKVWTEQPYEDRLAIQKQIAALPTAALAKKAGRAVRLRADWPALRLPVMAMLLRLKFADAGLNERLCATRPHQLVEGNDWGDTFWGVCRGQGDNHLGRLLMEIRG